MENNNGSDNPKPITNMDELFVAMSALQLGQRDISNAVSALQVEARDMRNDFENFVTSMSC